MLQRWPVYSVVAFAVREALLGVQLQRAVRPEVGSSLVPLPVLLRQRLRVLPGLGLVLRWSQEEARRAAQRVVLQMVWPGYPRRLQAFLLEVKQAALMEVLRALWLEALLPEFCRRRTSGRFLQRLSLGRLCLLFPLV